MIKKDASETVELLEQMKLSASAKVDSIVGKIGITEGKVSMLSEEAAKVNDASLYLKEAEVDTIEHFKELNQQIVLGAQMIEENQKVIELLTKNFQSAKSSVEEGKVFSSNAETSLQQIQEAIVHANECVQKSTQETGRMGMMIEEIEDIVSRTNLLAINASIEAARVGERGHGFQIVAEQIRTLSVQSKNAGDRIKQILGGLIKALNVTEEKISRGIIAVDQGIKNLEVMEQGLGMIDFYSSQSQTMLNCEVEVFDKISAEFSAMVEKVNQSMETAEQNIQEIEDVADSTQMQKDRVESALTKIKDMRVMAEQLNTYYQ